MVNYTNELNTKVHMKLRIVLILHHTTKASKLIISQLHRSLKEFNKKLIAVTSCLDAVVAGINALCAMVNQC